MALRAPRPKRISGGWAGRASPRAAPSRKCAAEVCGSGGAREPLARREDEEEVSGAAAWASMRARRGPVGNPAGLTLRALPRGLPLVMQPPAGEEGEAPGRGQAVLQSRCLSCGHFSVVDGEGCLFCDEDEDDSFSYEDWEAYSEPEEEKAPSASPATFCGFKKSFLCQSPVPTSPARNSQDCSLLSFVLPQKQQLTAEEAERNAEELVAEEERAKKKAEKKRLKKKRQKDRKRQEKRNQELEAKSQAQPAESSDGKQGAPLASVLNLLRPVPPEPEGSSSQGPRENLTSPGCSTEEEEELEEELDLTSTFVSKARLKVSIKPPLHKEKTEKEKTSHPERTVQREAPRPGLQKTSLEQSMVLADCGNETARRGCYREAVLLFTEAVKLNPREYRFFGNRSFCYEKLQCYPEALRDAQLALRLQPGWPKGLFRQGKALMGLKQYADAARTFEELLQMDGFQGDAATQLRRCHIQLLLKSLAPCATHLPAWNGLAQGAQLPLPEGRPLASCSPQGGMPLASAPIANLKFPTLLLPSAAQTPVRERFAVWVGNLTPKVTQDVLLRRFQPFGPIESIRCLPQKFCAFVNYTRREAAEAAYTALQGVEVEGRKLQLQLKHPVHATPPVARAPGGPQQPLRREQAPPPAAALGLPRPNGSHTKGDRCAFGPLPQQEAPAKKLQLL